MPFIFNGLDKKVVTKAFGNYFTFAPKQIKMMSKEHVRWFSSERAYEGLVALSDKFEDLEYKGSPEGKAEMAKGEKLARQHRVRHLRKIVENVLVSLKRDLQTANIQSDPRALASEGEIAAMEELAAYQQAQEDSKQKQVDKVKELEKLLKYEEK